MTNSDNDGRVGRLERLVGELRRYNRWRRGLEDWDECGSTPDPTLIGENIDVLCSAAERLSRVQKAAETYYRLYMIDEAEDEENCVCGEEQHQRAQALRDALNAVLPNTQVQRERSDPLQPLVGQNGD